MRRSAGVQCDDSILSASSKTPMKYGILRLRIFLRARVRQFERGKRTTAKTVATSR
jgi:hypothetical protein